MTDQDEIVPVGKIIGTHGIKGFLKIFSYSGNIESIKFAKSVFLKEKDGTLHEYSVNRVAPHAGNFILSLNNFSDINQVLHMTGSELCLKRSQFPPTAEDEYYWRDLIGLSVFTIHGDELGELVDIFETGSNDIYVIRNKAKEYLIPAIANVIASVDLSEGKMIISPLEGLLDL